MRTMRAVPILSVAALLAACSNDHSVGTRPIAGSPGPDVRVPSGPVAIVGGVEQAPPPIRMGDAGTIRRIIAEGRDRSQVMDNIRYLGEKIGPRLTGSTNAERANDWTVEKFRSWGIQAEKFQWGEIPVRFDRGPSSAKVLLKTVKRGEDGAKTEEIKVGREMQFTTLAWQRGTSGPVSGPVVRLPETEEDYEKVKEQLKGAWVLITPPPLTGPQGGRAVGRLAGERYTQRTEARKKIADGAETRDLPIIERVLWDGINGFIATSRDERVWTTAIPKWREKQLGDLNPDVEIIVRLSDYDYISSRLTDGEDFTVEIDLQHTLTQGPIPVYNTIAMIPGTTKPDEYVVLSAHMDSWNGPGSLGITDNGTGTSVMLEAMRILKASGARPARTIICGLWTGEEQGLLGSKGWVKANLDKMPRVSAALNDDGGTNSQGGLVCTPDMQDMLAAATAPVNYLFYDSATGKPLNVDIKVQEKFSRFGSSDHYSFVEQGTPGFFWEEVGRADYGFGWHTQNDRVELAIPEYLMQSATCTAITAFNLASADELLPRVPLPPPPEPTPASPTPTPPPQTDPSQNRVSPSAVGK